MESGSRMARRTRSAAGRVWATRSPAIRCGVYITGVAAIQAGTPATGTGNVVSYNMIGVTAARNAGPGQQLGRRGRLLAQQHDRAGQRDLAEPARESASTARVPPLRASPRRFSSSTTSSAPTPSGTQGFGNAYEGVRIDNSASNTIQGNAGGSQVISGNQVGVAIVGTQATAEPRCRATSSAPTRLD